MFLHKIENRDDIKILNREVSNSMLHIIVCKIIYHILMKATGSLCKAVEHKVSIVQKF